MKLGMSHYRENVRVFENMVLWRIFGPKSEKMLGGWRKLHNEELLNLCTASDVIKMIKSRRV
jgi:hypothetical protein